MERYYRQFAMMAKSKRTRNAMILFISCVILYNIILYDDNDDGGNIHRSLGLSDFIDPKSTIESFKVPKYINSNLKTAFDYQPIHATILNPSHFKPLIFGGGEGTTATHAFYDATCLLGLKSVHWKLHCNYPETNYERPSPGVMAHFDLLRAYNRLKNCATSPGDEEDFECPTVIQTLHVILDRINQVISSPDIDAIHDAPYPNFAEYVLIASKKIRGKDPIVVLSERNPQDWAERRIQHQTDVACRGNNINIGTNLYQCLQSAIQAGLGSQRINTIFYQFNELAGGDATNVTTIIGKGFELYQNKMRKVSVYHTNLFERNPRIDESQLAEEISYAIANTTLEESTASFRELSSSSPIHYAMDPKTVVHVRSGELYDLLLPSDQPDPKPQSLLDELLDHQLACPATSQVRISFDPHGDKNVILKSYSIDGEPKTEGGDEYYITYTDKMTENDFVDAVAYSRDMGDGTYVIEFVQPILPYPDGGSRPSFINGGGMLSVILQYTCSIGSLMPPTKADWSNGGAVNSHWTTAVNASVVPPIVMARDRLLPKQFGFAFSNYKIVLSVGDSLMSQFIGKSGWYDDPTGDGHQRRSNMEIGEHLGSSLRTDTVDFFLRRVKRSLDNNNLLDGTINGSAMILGSGVWDILDNPDHQPNFDDHLTALKQYIMGVKEMTDADIYWKSMTAMHINKVVSPRGFDRVRYMSSTRAKRINDLQVALMTNLSIPVLDMYNMTYEAQEFTRRGDGRHYTNFFNDLLMDYFYCIQNQG